jgi:hypothetical protein
VIGDNKKGLKRLKNVIILAQYNIGYDDPTALMISNGLEM